MTREELDSICPAEVLEAIPWYPDGLSDAKRGLVEAHAASCDDCRRELLMVQGEPIDELPEAPGADRVWAAVIERVAAEGAEAPVRALPAAPPQRARRSWVRAASRPFPLAASVALAVAFGALGTVAGSQLGGDDSAIYRSATAGRTEDSEAVPALDVVFRKSASAAEIESALRGVGGNVVAGPSSLGVYRIALRPGADAHGAASALRGDEGGVASLAELALP
jgi:hypothetical protein